MFSATPISQDWEHLKKDAEKNLYELAKSIGKYYGSLWKFFGGDFSWLVIINWYYKLVLSYVL